MQIPNALFELTDWTQVKRTEHKGERGLAYWKTRNFGDVRVRVVEYTPDYSTDHWCSKGHVVFCIDGQLNVELKDGRRFTLTPGASFQVGDQGGAHRSSTATGAKLFIVD